ncbi:MAG: ADP-ribosylation factor-like protein [Candidatus Heimdallarchaeaceae archaeon]
MDNKIKALLSTFKEEDAKAEEILELPVERIRGIGAKYSNILAQHGCKKIADLLSLDSETVPISKKLISKWKIAAKIIHDLTQGKTQLGRIVFSGLSFAGKTSIIHTLKHLPNKPAPTLGAKKTIYQIASHQIVISDMGGQKTFRDSYLVNPEQYFANTQVLFYVIDVQDLEKFDESVAFLERVLAIYRYLKETPKIGILLHKFDQDKAFKLKHIVPPYEKKIDLLFEKYWEFDHKKFYTSIFNPPSLFVAISSVLSKVFPVMRLIAGLLEDFAIDNNLDGLILLDDKGLLISQYLGKDEPTVVLTWAYAAYHKIIKENITSFTPLLLRKGYGKGELIVQKLYFPKGLGYAVFWVNDRAKSAHINNAILHQLTKNLNPWLYNLLYASQEAPNSNKKS